MNCPACFPPSLHSRLTEGKSDQTQAILSKLDEPQVPFLLTSEEDQCIRELFVTDPSADRDRIISDKGEITQGTCEWVLKEDSFKSWESTSPHLLWISAPPGMGKTYLSIFLSRHLEPESQQTAESATIYFFCDNKRAAQNTGINILRGLIYQLTQLRRELVKVLLSPWKAQSKLLFAPNALESLWQVFQHMIAALGDTYQTIHCLLDGMDECEDTSLSSLLVKLRSIANDRQTSGPTFKFIGVSRRYPDHIPRSLISFISLEIDESGRAKRDVERYIATQVMDLARKKNIVNSPLQSHIERIFKDRAEGTFLWVSFMVKDLESKSIAQIETALEDLPRGLDAVYDKIIAQMDPGKLELVTKLLQWIAFAKVPLTIPALCEAIGVNGTELLTREQVCLDYIQSCGHLLLTTKVDITKNMNMYVLPALCVLDCFPRTLTI